MNPNLTELIAIVDRSGSMSGVAADMSGGINTMFKRQAMLPGELKVTLVQFDTNYEILHDGVKIADVPAYTLEPRGGTALFDAIGRTIKTVGERLFNTPEDQRPSKILVMIVTDGAENASKEFNLHQIKDMIRIQRDDFKWEFVFLGANETAFAGGSQMGLGQHAYSTRGVNVRRVVASADLSLGALRGGDKSWRKSVEDIDQAKDRKEAP